jgi:hypothetical protein
LSHSASPQPAFFLCLLSFLSASHTASLLWVRASGLRVS